MCASAAAPADPTYRERFARTLAHQPVDRPPMDLGATDMTEIDGGPRRLAIVLGLQTQSLSGPEIDECVLRALDIDIRGVGGVLTPEESQARRLSPTAFVDAWGITHQWQGHHYEMVGRPLANATLADLDRFPWPDPERLSPRAIETIRQRARYLHEETPYVVCARHPCYGILELGCWMCGFEDFLYRLAADPDFVHRFFEIILNYQKRVIDIYYGAIGPFIHFTTSGDDFGTQTGPFISPQMFRDLIIPGMTERIRQTRRHTDAAFFHHSCGAIFDLIPDLIAAGVQILNPIQPGAKNMEPERLKERYGRDLTFYGGIDTQHLLPTGTPDQVDAETKRVTRVLSASGGFILSAAHCIQEDVPAENAVALFQSSSKTCGGRPVTRVSFAT
jgi:uroporphyrinogen decarboxylase